MDAEKSKVFPSGGLPTDPDIKELEKAFPVEKLVYGFCVYYNQVSLIIRARYKDSRFWTVTNAWRKRLRKNYGIVLKPNRNGAFEVLDSNSKVDFANNKLSEAKRKAGESLKISKTVIPKELSEVKKKEHENNIFKAGAISSYLAMKEIKGSTEKLELKGKEN